MYSFWRLPFIVAHLLLLMVFLLVLRVRSARAWGIFQQSHPLHLHQDHASRRAAYLRLASSTTTTSTTRTTNTSSSPLHDHLVFSSPPIVTTTSTTAATTDLVSSPSVVQVRPKVAAPSKRFVNFPFPYHQELVLKIESLTNRGWGVARVDLENEDEEEKEAKPSHGNPQDVDVSNDDNDQKNEKKKKWVVLVIPGVIPGETVRVRVFRNFPNYSEADVVEIVDQESHPHRRAPKCPVFSQCGGCQYQHMSIELQREWKTKHVQEALDQYGIVLRNDLDVSPCLGTSEIFGYRSKLTPHYQAPSSRNNRHRDNNSQQGQEIGKMIQEIGFQGQTSRQIVDVERCVIATEPINAAYQRLRQQLLSPSFLSSENSKKKNKGATLLLRQGNPEDDNVVINNHQEPLTTRVLEKNFTYLAGNFFQNNYHVLPLMVQHVVDAASSPLYNHNYNSNNQQSASTTTLVRPTHLVDCYCGSGLFAISASDRFETVVGIEINERAIQEATANAIQNNCHDNCQFVAATAEDIFQHLHSFPRDLTTVILDPPRKGCSDSFLQQLREFQPARIVYLSCDPTTQARDVQDLVQPLRTQKTLQKRSIGPPNQELSNPNPADDDDDDDHYVIDFVQPFDLFPMTRHIECLVVLNHQRYR